MQARAPRPRPSRAATRPPQGEDNRQALPFSRCVFLFAPELCLSQSQKPRRNPDLRQINPAVDRPDSSRSGTAHERTNGKKKRKQNAERRISNRRTCKVRRAPWRARSPSGVPLRLSPRGLSSPKAQRQAMLPETRPERSILNGRPNRGAETLRFSTGVTRAVLSPSSEHLARRSLCRQADTQAARVRRGRTLCPRAPQPAPPAVVSGRRPFKQAG